MTLSIEIVIRRVFTKKYAFSGRSTWPYSIILKELNCYSNVFIRQHLSGIQETMGIKGFFNLAHK
jgi:hypothetical protein